MHNEELCLYASQQAKGDPAPGERVEQHNNHGVVVTGEAVQDLVPKAPGYCAGNGTVPWGLGHDVLDGLDGDEVRHAHHVRDIAL